MLDQPTRTAKPAPGANPAAAEDAPKIASGEINAQSPETDGFQLVIDALKLNGIDTIFGLPGIPDHRPHAQAAGRRDARDLLPP